MNKEVDMKRFILIGLTLFLLIPSLYPEKASRLETLLSRLRELGWRMIYYKSEDTELWGNRGYVVYNPDIPEHKVKKITPPPLPPLPQPRLLSQKELEDIRKEIQSALQELTLAKKTRKEMEGYLKAIEEQLKAYQEKVEEGGEIYTVKKGDSLWKISRRYYGTPYKWPLIYRANKDVLKDPGKIYPGQKLKIPPPAEEEITPPARLK